MENNELKEFERKVKAREITNFEPYFRNQNQDQLRILKQICIRHGAYQEAYLDWASDGRDVWIQHTLTKHGYCLDVLVHADDAYVRESALRRNIRLALEPGYMEQNLDVVGAVLMSSAEPDKDVLNAYLTTSGESGEYYRREALHQKQAAYEVLPITVEKTMTPLQLYKTGNPMWTLSYTGEQVAIINQTLRNPLNDATVEIVFDAVAAGAKTTGDLVNYMSLR